MTDLYHSFDADIAAEGGLMPRRIMPQIDAADYGAMLDFLRSRGVTVRRVTVASDDLCIRQAVDERRVPTDPAIIAKALLLSADNCVLDGNHRAFAHRRDGTPATAYVLDRPFEEAFDILCEFQLTYTLGENAPIRN